MIKLYLDEDVPDAIALSLRLRGYDVVTVKDTGRKGLKDIEQIQHASSEKRVIFTHNIPDCAVCIRASGKSRNLFVSSRFPFWNFRDNT